MNKKKLIITIVFAIIVIAGIIVTATCGLKYDMKYLDHKEIDILIGKEFNNSDIYALVNETVQNKNIVIQKVELYEDMVSISVRDISDEDLSVLNNKINEKYGTENTIEDITVTNVPAVQIFDLIKPYIVPCIIIAIITLVYFMVYIAIKKRIGAEIKILEELLKVVLIIVAGLMLYVSVLTIVRVPVNRLTIPSIIVFYLITTVISMIYLEKNTKIQSKKTKK